MVFLGWVIALVGCGLIVAYWWFNNTRIGLAGFFLAFIGVWVLRQNGVDV